MAKKVKRVVSPETRRKLSVAAGKRKRHKGQFLPSKRTLAERFKIDEERILHGNLMREGDMEIAVAYKDILKAQDRIVKFKVGRLKRSRFRGVGYYYFPFTNPRATSVHAVVAAILPKFADADVLRVRMRLKRIEGSWVGLRAKYFKGDKFLLQNIKVGTEDPAAKERDKELAKIRRKRSLRKKQQLERMSPKGRTRRHLATRRKRR